MPRMCLQFYCVERGDRYCCVDCHLQKDCWNPCQNHPVRCGLENTDYTPPKRRGKKSKLLQLVADESVTHADFKSMTASCNEEIVEAERKIAEFEALVSESETFRVKIESIRKVMADAQWDAARGLIREIPYAGVGVE